MILELVTAEDRKWHRKKHHILRENIVDLIYEYAEYYDMSQLVAPDRHGYTGLMMVADTNLQENDFVVGVMCRATPREEITAVDEDGFSALDYAISRKNNTAIKEIQQALGR
jgi:hypothetical protein